MPAMPSRLAPDCTAGRSRPPSKAMRFAANRGRARASRRRDRVGMHRRPCRRRRPRVVVITTPRGAPVSAAECGDLRPSLTSAIGLIERQAVTSAHRTARAHMPCPSAVHSARMPFFARDDLSYVSRSFSRSIRTANRQPPNAVSCVLNQNQRTGLEIRGTLRENDG
jgi:hypothetical protein